MSLGGYVRGAIGSGGLVVSLALAIRSGGHWLWVTNTAIWAVGFGGYLWNLWDGVYDEEGKP